MFCCIMPTSSSLVSSDVELDFHRLTLNVRLLTMGTVVPDRPT